jgi:hypothetical protein
MLSCATVHLDSPADAVKFHYRTLGMHQVITLTILFAVCIQKSKLLIRAVHVVCVCVRVCLCVCVRACVHAVRE